MDATGRYLAYAVGQATAVGVLVGVAGALTLVAPLGLSHSYLAVAASGPAAGLAHRLVQALAVVVPVQYVLVPVGVAGYLAVTDRDDSSTSGRAFVAGGLLLVFVAGGLAGSFLAGPAGALIERQGVGSPQASFAYDYAERGDGRGVLTVTHDGGDTVRADRLFVEGPGITDVPDADQTEAGPWRGETSEATVGGGQPAVAPGDSVRVGVADDCVVRIVYRTEWSAATVGKYACPDATE